MIGICLSISQYHTAEKQPRHTKVWRDLGDSEAHHRGWGDSEAHRRGRGDSEAYRRGWGDSKAHRPPIHRDSHVLIKTV